MKTFFSWLGVTYYLSTEAINTMLAALSELCADGSSLVFDYPDENFFDASEKRVQNTIMMAKAGGEPMQSAFSYSEIEKLLEKHGFLIYELLTPDDIQRDIIDKAGADMKAFEHVNYCLAVRVTGCFSTAFTSAMLLFPPLLKHFLSRLLYFRQSFFGGQFPIPVIL